MCAGRGGDTSPAGEPDESDKPLSDEHAIAAQLANLGACEVELKSDEDESVVNTDDVSGLHTRAKKAASLTKMRTSCRHLYQPRLVVIFLIGCKSKRGVGNHYSVLENQVRASDYIVARYQYREQYILREVVDCILPAAAASAERVDRYSGV